MKLSILFVVLFSACATASPVSARMPRSMPTPVPPSPPLMPGNVQFGGGVAPMYRSPVMSKVFQNLVEIEGRPHVTIITKIWANGVLVNPSLQFGYVRVQGIPYGAKAEFRLLGTYSMYPQRIPYIAEVHEMLVDAMNVPRAGDLLYCVTAGSLGVSKNNPNVLFDSSFRTTCPPNAEAVTEN